MREGQCTPLAHDLLHLLVHLLVLWGPEGVVAAPREDSSQTVAVCRLSSGLRCAP